MILFRILYIIDCLFALVVLYFFFLGLSDGSVYSINIVYWLAILGMLVAVMGGSWRLKSKGYLIRANLTLLILALPALLCVAYLLIIITMDVRWN